MHYISTWTFQPARFDSLIMRRDSWYLSSCFLQFRLLLEDFPEDSGPLPPFCWLATGEATRANRFLRQKKKERKKTLTKKKPRRIFSRGAVSVRTSSRWRWNGIKSPIAALHNVVWPAVNSVSNDFWTPSDLASVSSCVFFFFFFHPNSSFLDIPISHIPAPYLELSRSAQPLQELHHHHQEWVTTCCMRARANVDVDYALTAVRRHRSDRKMCSFCSEVTTFPVFLLKFLLVCSSSRHSDLIGFNARMRARSRLAGLGC